MSLAARRQQSLAHYARAVQEWRAKGWGPAAVMRMLVSALELTRSVHRHPVADALVVLDIANGARAA